MSKEDIFEELKFLRTMIEENPEYYGVIEDSYLVERLQEIIWKIGKDIGEF
jgi:hypothetical protein